MRIAERPAVARVFALVSGGLLAGAFGYGAVNVLYAFRRVPLDVRFTFHTALMSVNGVVMQTLMGLTILSAMVLAARSTGRSRLLAGSASLLAIAAFLITRLGNVPINQKIKIWAISGPPADYAEILTRWETFHVARTACAVLAFLLIALTTLLPAKS
ncbi:anthrone oxygenase family protein [Nocardia sp. NPDC004750]